MMNSSSIVEIEAIVREHVSKNVTTYPKPVIEWLSSQGIVGGNVPIEFGGKGLTSRELTSSMKLLSKWWLALPALLGSNHRVIMYLLECGTASQKADLLPKAARGQLIFAHAYNEQGIRNRKKYNTVIRTTPQGAFLSGKKHWVTNAVDADCILVIARDERFADSRSQAILLTKNTPGVSISPELNRIGMRGVSLCSIDFENVEVTDEMFIGGNEGVDGFIEKYKTGSSINFAARAVGVAERVVEIVESELQARLALSITDGREVLIYNYGRILELYWLMNAVLEAAMSETELPNIQKESRAYLTKTICTRELQNILSIAMMVVGGKSYAASDDNELGRLYQDSISLILIDTPNDVLLHRSGEMNLEC